MNSTWECPICGSNAYQRYGGVTVPATKVTIKDNQEVKEPTSWQFNRHFMCKGCSVFFANPNKFNKGCFNGTKS